MKRFSTLLILLIAGISLVFAQEPDRESMQKPTSARRPVYKGKYHTVDENGDSVLMIVFNDVTVFQQLKFKNKKEEEFYWRGQRR